jgi:glucose-6-phosphate isomerase
MKIKIDDAFLGKERKNSLVQQQNKANEMLQLLVAQKKQDEKYLGWYDYPKEKGLILLDDVEEKLKNYPVYYDLIVVIGIGGSYAGYRGLYEIFQHSFKDLAEQQLDKKPVISIGHNLSEKMFIDLFDVLDSYQPVCVLISKSGSTTETNLAYSLLNRYLYTRFGSDEAKARTIIVTDKEKGLLRKLATKHNHLSFDFPENIGGRYSVLTAVGMLPLTLAGFQTRRLMEGADAFFGELRELQSIESHPCIQYAAVRKLLWDEGKRIELLIHHEPSLGAFVEWWKQLFSESEGKNDGGLFPSGALFSTDLHSLGQYLQEGYPGVLETFLMFEEYPQSSTNKIEKRIRAVVDESFDTLNCFHGHFIHDINHAAMKAACSAHSERGNPCFTIRVPKCDEYYMGYLVAFFQTVCAVSSMLLGVNPFDQPGVEQYKKKLKSFIGVDNSM